MSKFNDKSQEAAAAARLLLDRGFADSAVNRAYFAMFHAARSLLARMQPDARRVKRHATIIGLFSRLVVRERGIDPSFGRSFNLAFDRRLLVDYEPRFIDLADARDVVADMDRFLAEIERLNQEDGV